MAVMMKDRNTSGLPYLFQGHRRLTRKLRRLAKRRERQAWKKEVGQ